MNISENLKTFKADFGRYNPVIPQTFPAARVFSNEYKRCHEKFHRNECDGESALGEALKNKDFTKFIKKIAIFGKGEGRISISINPKAIWKAAKSVSLEPEKIIKNVNKILQP